MGGPLMSGGERDPLESAMQIAPSADWLPIGRLGSAQVLASRPGCGRWILCWDLPGSRLCAVVVRDRQLGGLAVLATSSGRRLPEADPLPYLLRRAGMEAGL